MTFTADLDRTGADATNGSLDGHPPGHRKDPAYLPSSREETKLILLLDKTEQRISGLAAVGTAAGDEKVHFYVKQLDNWLGKLEKHAQVPCKDVMGSYRSRVTFLQKVLEDLTPPTDPVPKLGVNVPGLSLTVDTPLLISDGLRSRRRKLTSTADGPATPTPSAPKIKPFRSLPRAAGQDGVVGKQIHQKREQRHQLDEREELFGLLDEDLGSREVSVAPDSDLDDLIKAHHKAQEQVAEEMLGLTRALKEQTLAAGEIIRKDVVTLESTNDLAEKNTSRLGVESARLADHTKTSCRCWIWFVLLVVTITFIAMVMVMKIFRKRWT